MNTIDENNKGNSKFNLHDFISSKLKFDDRGRCTNAFQILSDPLTLKLAYNAIKSKPGNMSFGIDKITLDGIDKDWFIDASISLLNESFSPKPVRRVYIPKPNGKFRPLGVGSPRDKIIQQSMLYLLETILNPIFLESSHGFRPNRGCHTALKAVRSWKGVTWFIEGDIVGFFDNINHKVLANLLKRHFNEARFIHLYWKLVKAGYVEFDKNKKTFVATDVGTPQGSIISPILSNLILHELDLFIEGKIKTIYKLNEGLAPYKTNPAYHRITVRLSRLKKKISILKADLRTNSEAIKLLRKQFSSLIKSRNLLKSTIPNTNRKPYFEYVRYADDWLIGLWGSKKDANMLKEEIKLFLKNLALELSPEKTLITNARNSRAKFLGTYIKRLASPEKGSTLFKNRISPSNNKKNHKRRIPTGNLWMTAPILEIVKKLATKEFLKILKKPQGNRTSLWRPLSIGKFTLLPVRDIIIRYNSILNGFVNYYSFADNKPYLDKIWWILKESLRKTLSRKLKLNKKEFLRKFGEKIQIKLKQKDGSIRTISFSSPNLKRTPMRFLGASKFSDPVSNRIWKVSTIDSLGYPCVNCGSSDNIEMHHVRHIRTINPNLSPFDEMMAKINRKQVPLCHSCHSQVHRGNYNGLSLKYYSSQKINLPVD